MPQLLEFMARGSLKKLLHDASLDLTWEFRLSALRDTATGMLYLHNQTPPAIHRDLKSGKPDLYASLTAQGTYLCLIIGP